MAAHRWPECRYRCPTCRLAAAAMGGTNYVAFFLVLAVVALIAALTILPIRRIR